jgi:hypothetical protein
MRDSRRLVSLRSYALAFAVALSPAFFQTQYSCERGDTFLRRLELEVSYQDQILGFDPNDRHYDVTLSSNTVILRTETRHSGSEVSYQWMVEDASIESGTVGVGGGAVVLDVPPGQSTLRVNVRSAELTTGSYIVNVDHISWGSAELLETDDVGWAREPKVAVDDSGDAVALWEQFDGIQWSIYANRLMSGVWGGVEVLETGDAGNALDPQLALAPNGDGVAVWEQSDGVRFNVYANRLTMGVWGGVELIETVNTGNASDPQVAVDPNGDAVVVWHQYDGTRYNLYARRLISGDWAAPELLESAVGTCRYAQVAVTPNGDAVVVWQQTDAGSESIYANRLTSGAWSGAELLEPYAGDGYSPEIAVGLNGDALAVWQQFDDGGERSIYANQLISGAWAGVEPLETEAGSAIQPQVAIDPSGDAVVVWRQSDGSTYNIYANRLVSGAWVGRELVETNDPGYAYPAQLAVDASGDAVVVWFHEDALADNIYANRLSAGVWRNAELLETDDTGDAGWPEIAVDPNGDAVVVWQQFDGVADSVYANRLQ